MAENGKHRHHLEQEPDQPSRDHDCNLKGPKSPLLDEALDRLFHFHVLHNGNFVSRFMGHFRLKNQISGETIDGDIQVYIVSDKEMMEKLDAIVKGELDNVESPEGETN